MDSLIEKYDEESKLIESFLILKYKQIIDGNSEIKIKDIFKCENGGTFKSSEYVNKSEYKLITIKNIDTNGFNTNDLTYIEPSSKYLKYKLNIGDILLTMTGAYLGRCGMVSVTNCFQNQRLLKVTGESKAFTYCFLKFNEKNIYNLGKGSAQPNLSLADFLNMKINCKKSDIDNFKIYDCLIDKFISIKLKQNKLKTQKDLLLKKYFG